MMTSYWYLTSLWHQKDKQESMNNIQQVLHRIMMTWSLYSVMTMMIITCDHTSIIFIIYIFHIHLLNPSHPSIKIIILIFSVIMMMMIIINPSIINIIIIIYSVMMIVDDLPSIIIITIIYSLMMVDDCRWSSINQYHNHPIHILYSTDLDDPMQKNSSWQQQTQRNKLHNLV